MAKKVVFSIDQGTDTQIDVSVRNRDGQVVDMASARMQLRPKIESTTISDELTTENDRIIIDASAGTLSLIFPNATTTGMAAGTYAYDLEVIDSQDMVTRVIEGTITIRPEVTRNNPVPDNDGS